MHREATRYQGAMHAIIGLPIHTVQELVAEVQQQGMCLPSANHNTRTADCHHRSAGQWLKRFPPWLLPKVPKPSPLKVSGAWHSELIKGARDEFRDIIESMHFNPPDRPVVFNVTADYAEDPNEIKSIHGPAALQPRKMV